MPTTDPVLAARSRVANASRKGADRSTLQEAYRDLNAARVERAIQRALATAPPLTDEQKQRLAALLTGGAR